MRVKPNSAQMMMLHRIQSAGCPVDYSHCQHLYAAWAKDVDLMVPAPIEMREEGGKTQKSRDVEQGIKDCPTVGDARDRLAYLFSVTQSRMELCRAIDEKIGVPCPEGLQLEKLLVTIVREMRQLERGPAVALAKDEGREKVPNVTQS